MAGKFNDEQLRAQALKLSDPYEQSNLIWSMPEGAHLLDIINIYIYDRFPLRKAYCVKCGGRRHKRGFTAMLTTGHRLLYGRSCGEDQFGESWTEAEKRIGEKADRQYELKKLDRLEIMIGALELGLLSWLPAMEQVSNRRRGFDRQLGELASRVREAVAMKAGALTVFRKAHNSAAHAARTNRLGDHQEVAIGQLVGIEFLHRLDPAKAVTSALTALNAVRGMLGATDGASTRQMRSRRRDFERALEDVETAATIHAGAEEFLTSTNFAQMVQWANDHEATQARYILGENNIVRVEGSAGGIQISAPPPIDTRLLDLIQDYRRAD